MSKWRLPAEWEQQTATLLTLPDESTDWAPFLSETITCYSNIVNAILRYQHVILIVRDNQHLESFQASINSENQHKLVPVFEPFNDTWIRDYGPITVINNDRAMLNDFVFNAWGGKYDAKLDNLITARLEQRKLFGETAIKQVNWVLEGGAIDCNGKGSLITTTSCLLKESRNGKTSRQANEDILREHLGIDQVIWLESTPLPGDDTDGHVDTIARFINQDHIFYTEPDETPLSIATQINQFNALNGTNFTTIRLPLPEIQDPDTGKSIPATYANFLFVNGAVLVPVYQHEYDNQALEIFQEHLPEHEVIAIDCRPLIRQYGSLHCATMQLPATVNLSPDYE